MFKNLWFYQATSPLSINAAVLEEQLDEKALRDCGPQERQTSGFVAPLEGTDERLFFQIGDQGFLLVHSTAERVLPAGVIKDAVQDKVSQLETQTAGPVSAKKRRDIKDEVLLDLMPRAFVQRKQVPLLILPAQGLLIIDTASAKTAELVQQDLRQALGSLPVVLPERPNLPTLMSNWLLASAQVPADVEVADACQMRDKSDVSATVTFKGQELTSPEVQSHLRSGMEVIRLKLIWQDRWSFTMHHDCRVTQLRMEDQLRDSLDAPEEDPVAQLDQDMTLILLEARALWDRLKAWFPPPSS